MCNDQSANTYLINQQPSDFFKVSFHPQSNRRDSYTLAVIMAASLEDTLVSYEDLADIEKDFEDVELETGM